MSEQDVTKIVDAVLANRQRGSDISKRIATVLTAVVAIGAVYSVFFQPQTLAAAADNSKILIREHTTLIHKAQEKRLDRMEGKIDRLIERKPQ